MSLGDAAQEVSPVGRGRGRGPSGRRMGEIESEEGKKRKRGEEEWVQTGLSSEMRGRGTKTKDAMRKKAGARGVGQD